MRAKVALPRIVEKSLPTSIHARRRATLIDAVAGAVSGEILTLTGIGRSLPAVGGRTSVKHEIKRMDRLLGNVRLQEDASVVYKRIINRFIGGVARPVILVDWTPLDRERAQALVASVPVDGRSQIICAKLVSQAELGSPAIQGAFLDELAKLIPSRCRPIIVADAGFQTSWCKAVAALGWDYVVRVRGRTKYKSKECGQWRSVKMLYKHASIQPVDIGEVSLTQKHARSARLVMSAAPRKKTPSTRPRRTSELKHATAQCEPWLLATSIDDLDANAIVAAYRKRMQIEETFRDAKSSRFGFALEHARGRTDRLAVLVLIAALATMALLLIGISAELSNAHYRFQANTVRRKRVLSLIRLAAEIWRADHPLRLQLNPWSGASPCEGY